VELSRSEDEDYRARASFDVDSLGGTVLLEELGLRFDALEYSLSAPASLAWTDSSVTIHDFELIRPGSDPASLRADGTISWRGQADFTLTSRGIPLERLLQLAQREALDMSGRVDLDMTVAGMAASPTIEGSFSGDQVRARTAEVSRVDGVFTYRDRDAELSLEAWRDELRILEVSGRVPVDLALGSVADRTPAGDMDLRIRADSLPAVFVLSLLEDLENVEGTVTGDVNVAGSLDDPEPRGTLHLRGGAWTVAALGVRQSAVEATLELAPDGVVAVQATGRAGGGRASVEGNVTVSPLADPGLDLAIRLDRFQAVDRRDVEGTVSGEVQLTQRFRRPVITGDLRVDEGILHLEEFQRSAGVVDLADPRFFTYVDTSLLSGRPLLAGTRNPFMDSLRVNVALAVERGTFLRSQQMNVEIGGDLIVTYDRAAQDIVMIGELEAVRGQYTFLSRTFDVRSGTVDFLGTPGINPNLDIQAVARVRRREADPLDITANLTGTLVDPRVRLSAEGQAVSESDLISYLVFGRPSSEFNSFFAGGRGGTGGMSDGLLGEGASFLSSTLAASLASLAQGIGWVDYLSVSQTADVSASSGGLSPFAGTQVEIGQYFLGGDYFAAVTLRPLSGTGRSNNILGGFRLEWQASDQYHVEAFAEDRFLRGGGYGYQELGIRSSLIYGLSLFREWGY
jgi:translocation and assembly module TamB